MELLKQYLGHNVDTKKIVIAVFAVLMVIAFALPSLFRNQFSGSQNAIALVNGQEIARSSFSRREYFLQDYLRSMQQRQALGDLGQVILDGLVQEELINQVMQPLVPTPADAYVAQKILDASFIANELAEFIPPRVLLSSGGLISMQTIHSILGQRRIPVSEFECFVENALRRHVAYHVLGASTWAPRFVIKNERQRRLAKKSFSILSLDLDTYLKEAKKESLSDQELQLFFDEANAASKRYVVPEKRRAVTWTFDPAKYGITVDEAMAKQYYDEHRRQFIKEPARVEIRRILFAVQNDDTPAMVHARAAQVAQELAADSSLFEQKAKEFSDDKETASKGGLVGYVKRGEKDKGLEQIIFGLREDGAISELIETPDGFEILQRVSRKKPIYNPFESVKKDVIKQLTHREFKKRFGQEIGELLPQTDKASADAFTAFAGQKHAKKQTIDWMANDQSALAQRLFKLKGGKKYVTYKDNDQGIVVMLDGTQRPYTPELAAVRDQVSADLYERKAAEQLSADARSAQELAKMEPFADVAKRFDVRVTTIGQVDPQDETSQKPLTDMHLPVDVLVGMTHEGGLFGHAGERSWYLVRLDQLVSADDEQKDAGIARDLGVAFRYPYLNSFIASLHKNATIESNISTNSRRKIPA